MRVNDIPYEAFDKSGTAESFGSQQTELQNEPPEPLPYQPSFVDRMEEQFQEQQAKEQEVPDRSFPTGNKKVEFETPYEDREAESQDDELENPNNLSFIDRMEKRFQVDEDFERKEPEEPFLSAASASRYAAQPIKSALYWAGGLPGVAWEVATSLESGMPDEEEMEIIEKRFPDRDIRGELETAATEAYRTRPSISGMFNLLEDSGYKVEAKTKGQKATSVVSDVFAFVPGFKVAAVAGIMAGVAYERMVEGGVPDWLAGIIARFGVGGVFTKSNWNSAKLKPTPQKLLPQPEPPPRTPGNTSSAAALKFGETKSNVELGSKAIAMSEQLGRTIPPTPETPTHPTHRTVPRPTGTQRAEQPNRLRNMRPNVLTGQQGNAEAAAQRGLEGTPRVESPVEIEDAIGNAISPTRIGNKVTFGDRTQRFLRLTSENMTRRNRNRYRASEESNSQRISTEPDLVAGIDNVLNEADNNVAYKEEGQLINMLRTLRGMLVADTEHFDADLQQLTRHQEFVPISKQHLINQMRQFRKFVQYKYTNDPSNVFYRAINLMEQAIERPTGTIENEQNAIDLFRFAQAGHREWAEIFNTKYIKPIIARDEFDYEGITNKLLKPDRYNRISHVLDNGSIEGASISRELRREIVSDQLEPLLRKKDGTVRRNILGSNEFNRAIREMPVTLHPNEVAAIRNAVRPQTYPVRASKPPKPIKPPKIELRLDQKYANMTPEQIEARLSTVSGIKEFENMFRDATPEQKEMVQSLKRDIGIRILTKNKIANHKDATIENVLNDADSVAQLREFLGHDVVDSWMRDLKKVELVRKLEKQIEDDLVKSKEAAKNLKQKQKEEYQLEKEKEAEEKQKTIDNIKKGAKAFKFITSPISEIKNMLIDKTIETIFNK